MIGLENGVVRLVPYMEDWGRLYTEEASRVHARIGADLIELQHVGSTAIPGVEAKPIIDLAAAVHSFEESRRCIRPLEEIGYVYKGEYGIPRRHYFVKGDPRLYHLHMLEIQSEEWSDQLLFRDTLRQHPETATQYTRLKRELARRFPGDRGAYTDGKSEFVRAILRRAGA